MYSVEYNQNCILYVFVREIVLIAPSPEPELTQAW